MAPALTGAAISDRERVRAPLTGIRILKRSYSWKALASMKYIIYFNTLDAVFFRGMNLFEGERYAAKTDRRDGGFDGLGWRAPGARMRAFQ
jgi:hypothetical protein